MASSFKSLAADGVIKKDDIFKAKHDQFRIEPGHNTREMDSEEVQAHIESMFKALMRGDELPPLLARVDQDGIIWIVDGECRWHSYDRAIKAGKNIEWIRFNPFRGNDLDRKKRMLKANQGLVLSQLAKGKGYLAFADAFGYEDAQIADEFGVSVEAVKQLLKLARANHDVHQHVKNGSIAAHLAIEMVDKHGDRAGAVIADQLASAAAQGKSKVTKSFVVGRAIPKVIVTGLVNTVAEFSKSLDKNTRIQLASLEMIPEADLADKRIEVSALALLQLLQAQNAVDEDRAKQQKKAAEKESKAKQVAMAV